MKNVKDRIDKEQDILEVFQSHHREFEKMEDMFVALLELIPSEAVEQIHQKFVKAVRS